MTLRARIVAKEARVQYVNWIVIVRAIRLHPYLRRANSMADLTDEESRKIDEAMRIRKAGA